MDPTIYPVGADPELYTVELNTTANDVKEQVQKGNIALIKHTDDGETGIETPESGAEFQVYLKSSGSYDAAADSERDFLTCDENGYAKPKTSLMAFIQCIKYLDGKAEISLMISMCSSPKMAKLITIS